MGIPNLTRSLNPHSTPILLCKAPDQAPSTTSTTTTSIKCVPSIIIDGPGLIYHIYHRLLSQKPAHLNAIDAQPSCAEVSAGVVRFLGCLLERGVDVKKVYFDGALPVQKRDVRGERMEAGRRKIEAFRAWNGGGFKGSSTSTSTSAVGAEKQVSTASLFGSEGTKSPEKFNGLPENPFMMPSAIEDLKSYWTWGRVRQETGGDCGAGKGKGDDSELAFADMVEMVPNEADIYCAEVARLYTEGPIAVLTSDSDLLVHDLGVWGSVVFFDSLELSSDEDGGTVKAMEFHPAAIADRLGVVSIPRFAFEMKYERGLSKGEAIRRAKDSSGRVEESASFKAFMEEYEPLPAGGGCTRPGIYNSKLGELVAQYEFPSLRGKDPEEGYHVYLPILIEDHTRRSAWVDGTDIRILAYSFLNLTSPPATQKGTILEFSRRGPRITPSTLTLLTSYEEIVAEVKPLLAAFRKTRSLLGAAKEPLKFWTIFALLEIYTADVASGDIPSHKETINFLTLGLANPTKLFWGDIHRYARVLGVLYSVMLLKQVMDVITARGEWYHAGMLSGWVSSLPGGRELLCDKRERGALFKSIETVDIAAGLMGMVNGKEREEGGQGDGEAEEGWVDGGKGKGKGRKRGRGMSKGEGGSEKDKKKGKKWGGNMFDVLAGMG